MPGRQVIAEFRANGGKVGGYFAGMPLLLLTTTGVRTGRRRTVALTSLADDDRYIVLAANAGAPRHPDWYHNLVADPEVTVEVGTGTFEATARSLDGEDRDALYQRFADHNPQLPLYQARTARRIPVIALHRGKLVSPPRRRDPGGALQLRRRPARSG